MLIIMNRNSYSWKKILQTCQKFNVENNYCIWEGTLFNFWILKPISQPRSQPNNPSVFEEFILTSTYPPKHTHWFFGSNSGQKNWEKVHTLNRVWDYLPIPQRLKFINFFTPVSSSLVLNFWSIRIYHIFQISDSLLYGSGSSCVQITSSTTSLF